MSEHIWQSRSYVIHIVELYTAKPAVWYKFIITTYKKTQEFYHSLKFNRIFVTSNEDYNLITNFMYYAMNIEPVLHLWTFKMPNKK
jgi:hypothetical protein